jgi:SNF family Na+-dependent transporter
MLSDLPGGLFPRGRSRRRPQTAFITIPQILLEMPAGHWIGIAFFFLLSAAAIAVPNVFVD